MDLFQNSVGGAPRDLQTSELYTPLMSPSLGSILNENSPSSFFLSPCSLPGELSMLPFREEDLSSYAFNEAKPPPGAPFQASQPAEELVPEAFGGLNEDGRGWQERDGDFEEVHPSVPSMFPCPGVFSAVELEESPVNSSLAALIDPLDFGLPSPDEVPTQPFSLTERSVSPFRGSGSPALECSAPFTRPPSPAAEPRNREREGINKLKRKNVTSPRKEKEEEEEVREGKGEEEAVEAEEREYGWVPDISEGKPRRPRKGRRTRSTRQDPRLEEVLKEGLKRDEATKEFVCPLPGCGQVFKRREHLQRHARMHTGIKPHLCRFCGKRFSRADNLKQHEPIHWKARRSL